MRRIALIAALIAAGGAGVATVAGADDTHTYKLEMYDAFGLVPDAEVKVAGTVAGKITDLDINAEKRALVTVELSGPLAVLGDETECKSEPQSLIAEYFLDCQPAGTALEDGATVPNLVTQTVQNDLVLNTLRLPYRQRLTLLINEFGTALAGNPENLNQAIEAGAPALQDLHEALRLLAQQNRTIAQLNVDSDEIVGKLEERTQDVVRFVQEAGDTAVASAQRRDDLSTDFDLLDDALRELGPTMAELENVAIETTPLLADLRLAAPGLNTLATNLPAFARAGERSLTTLGKAAKPGIQALKRGDDEIRALAEAADSAPPVAKQAKLLLDDISDPRRAVAWDARADEDTGRTNEAAGQPDTQGYTGMEGLLNYFYYFGGALNQFDDVGHFLHFSLYDVFAGAVRRLELEAALAAQARCRPPTRRPGCPPAARPSPRTPTPASACSARTSPGSPRASRRRTSASGAIRARSAPRARPTSRCATRTTRPESSPTRGSRAHRRAPAIAAAARPAAAPAASRPCPPIRAGCRNRRRTQVRSRTSWRTCSTSRATPWTTLAWAAARAARAAAGAAAALATSARARTRPRRTSSTSSSDHEPTQSRSRPRSLADDGRGGHDPDRDRRRVPGLQRQQRAAVRARSIESRSRSRTPPGSETTTRSGSAAPGWGSSSRSSRS